MSLPHLARTHRPARIAGCLTLLARLASAQPAPTPPLVVTPAWSTEQYRSSRSPIDLTLDRPLDQPTEQLALVIGTTDVSALIEIRGLRARYRPTATRLPAGETEVAAFLVTDRGWLALGRFALKVRGRAGLDRRRVLPSVDLSSTGQLDQGGSEATAPARRTSQDLTLRMGLETDVVRGSWRFASAGNALGVSQETQRLRWGAMQRAAPAVDLSDYRVHLSRGGAHVAVGNVSVAGHRYLIDGFGSRGAVAGLRLGSRGALDLSMVNGTNVVGWSNLIGLGQPDHRISSATLTLDMVPSRPGAMQLSFSGLDGSVLPLSGFNQGSATDAEQSRGLGARMTMSDARQRVRLDAGLARSRFVNPIDPLLAQDTTLVAVRPTARSARYGELAWQLVQGRRITRSIAATLGASLRHERIDPLYKSIGATPQADLESNGVQVTGSLGALAVQGAFARTHDNLAGIRSILTSRTRNASLTAALPLGALVRRSDAWYFPQLSYGWQRSGQLGDGAPENGDFSLTHVPNQVSVNQTGTATWTHGSASLSYRWNQSFQDNRQVGRERSDFRAVVHGISFGAEPTQRLTTSVDLGAERQASIESGVTPHLTRLGSTLRWQATRTTDLSGTLSQVWAFDPSPDIRRRNTDLQLEVSQGVNLYRKPDGGTQSRVFVRFARAQAASHPRGVVDNATPVVSWTLNAGGSLRLY